MSTGAEIKSAIEKLSPEEQAQVARFIRMLEPGWMWTPEELGEAAQRMVGEADPAQAKAQCITNFSTFSQADAR